MIITSVQQGAFASTILIFFVVVFAKLMSLKTDLNMGFGRAKQALRLSQFALANNFTYTPAHDTSGYTGLLFTESGPRSFFDTAVNGNYAGLPFEFSNVTFVTGSGKNERRTKYGVVCITLLRRVPHVLLDSRHNNSWGMSNFSSLKRSQRLQLEGNFNQYFDLYVPHGYERDALYFLTPELMALLIDSGAKFDVELVDDKLFIYSSKPFKLEAQEAVQRIFELVSSIGAEFQENTQRYADANVGNRAANVVADPGKRLKKSWPWVAIIVIVVYVVLVILD